MISRIHMRRDLIAKDTRLGTQSLAIGVETTGLRKRYGASVTIHGPSRIVYRPTKPLKCGARAWIESRARVTVHRPKETSHGD